MLQTDHLYKANGFSVIDADAASDISVIRDWILKSVNKIIKSTGDAPFSDWNYFINYYSLYPCLHDFFSHKSNRLFSSRQVEALKTLIYKSTEQSIGKFFISSEENSGYPQIYWRITRPNRPEDVGPMHKDSWFWQLNLNGQAVALVLKDIKWFQFNEPMRMGFWYYLDLINWIVTLIKLLKMLTNMFEI